MRRFIFAFVLLSLTRPAFAEAPAADFPSWLQAFRQDAQTQGVARETLDVALTGVEPIQRVIELDRQQPETTLTFEDYLDRVASDARRDSAHQHYLDNKDLLDAVSARYGVPPSIIVALWAVETNFGRSIGKFPVVAALATLAYDGRRSAFFRGELIKALLIVQNDHIDPHAMIGSWAGAMGQSQFMPSSFLAYAVSYTGNGPPDIWNRTDDVFASIANYLARSGWKAGKSWGEEVTVPPGFDSSLAGKQLRRPVVQWAALGVRREDGSALPDTLYADNAALLEPAGPDGPAYLVYDNFNVILRWNNSSFFAIAAGTIADSVDAP